MSLKKPSEYFKKDIATVDNSVRDLVKTPELNTFSDAFESFKKNLGKIEVLSEFSDTLDNYRVNIERVNHLSEKVEDIQTEVQSLLKKEDLDRAMMSQLIVVEQSIRDVQSKVKGINEKNLTEIRLDVSGLTNSVNEFLKVEVPKYKKLVVDSEIRTNNRYEELEKNVNETLEGIGDFVDDKYQELTENLQGINEQSLAGILEDFKSLDKIVSELKEQEIPKYKGFIVETEKKTESKLNDFQDKLDETVNSILEKVDLIEGDKTDLVGVVNQKIKEIKNVRDYVIEDLKNSEEYKKQISKKVTDLEVEIVRNESHIKVQNKNLEQIQENVRSAIEKLNLEELEEKNYELGKKVKYLEEVFEKFNEKEILTENIIVEPPSTDNKDPLTPLDQNFVTLDQLQQHYRLFINRIQQQLSTLGGGGETRLKYLDDIVGIATNPSAYDNKFLKYNHTLGKFEFVTVSGGGGGSQTLDETLQLGNTSTLGVNVGVSTFTTLGVGTVYIGTESEALFVEGNARVTGILTIGTSSITLDGINDIITIGTGLTLTSSGSVVFPGIVTASSFIGDGSGLTGILTSTDIVGLASVSYVDNLVAISTFSGDYNDLSNTPEIPSIVGLASEGYVDNLVAISTFSGDYNDLSNTPNIPTDTGDLTNSVGFVTSSVVVGYATEGYVDNLVSISTFSGDYNDLSNTPEIPSIVGLASEGYVNSLVSISTFSGDYNDLSNTPEIPSIVGLASEGYVDNLVAISTFSGDYNDLTNQPSIPSIVGLASEGYVDNLVAISTFSGDYNDLSNKPDFSTVSVAYATSAGIATYTSEWTLGADGSSNYTFTGPGITGAENDPTLYLVRGQQYKFTSNLGATHPFRIQSTPNGSTGTQYNDGITNNDLQNGTLTWDVQFDSPDVLYYQCTNHGSMGGKIYILNENSNYSTNAGVATYASVAGIATYADNAGIATYALTSGISTSVIGGIASVTQLSVSGLSTFTGIGTFGSDLYVGGNVNVVGVVTATSFYGDGSGLTGIVAAGSGVVVKDSGSLVGTAGTIDFGTNLSVSPISAGVVTVTASGGGGGESYWVSTAVGIHTLSNVGIGTTNPTGVVSSANTSVLAAGIVTAYKFYGDGSNLTGIVTSITAGSGISIDQTTGNVTITNTGGGGGGASVSVGATPPVSPSSGDLWYNTNLLRTFIYYNDGDSSQWVDASPFNYGESTVGMTKNVSSYIATESQTTFNATYTVGFVDVYMNGAKLSESQYTATTGTSIVLNEGASLNDIVEIVGFVGGINGVGIATAGGVVGTGVTLFDFRGPGISTVTVSSGIGTINITGGGGSSSSGSGTIVNELDVMLFG